MSRELRVLFAHTAAECPNQETCWARSIHEKYASRDRLTVKAEQCDCFPHGPDDPCTCDGCWACSGHEVGCACDIAWDCEHGVSEHAHSYVDTAIGRLCLTCRDRNQGLDMDYYASKIAAAEEQAQAGSGGWALDYAFDVPALAAEVRALRARVAAHETS